MNIEPIVFVFFIVVSFGVLFYSRIVLRNEIKQTGEEIAKLRPEYESLNIIYHVIFVSITLLALFIFSIAINSFKNSDFRVVFLGFPFFSVLTIYEGLFALVTNVYPTTVRWNWNSFVYDDDNSLRHIAITQVFLAILLTVVCIIAFQISG